MSFFTGCYLQIVDYKNCVSDQVAEVYVQYM